MPEVIKTRIEKELNIIGGNSKSVMRFILANKITANAKEKGYIVGNRDSAGTSFVANLIGITNVNPLDAHYFCEKCKYIEFHNEENCGVDLPDKVCPKCGNKLLKDGYTLPEEVYIGYDSERELGIDLNLPEELLDESKEVVKNAVKNKVVDCGENKKMAYESAYTIVHKYADKRKLKFDNMREIEYCDKLNKSKLYVRPAHGVLVLPQNKDICDYTPVQHSAGGTNKKVTHFEYNYLHDILLKMNLLTHNSFPMLYKFEKATGVKANEIPLDDKETMELIKCCDVDGIREFEHESAKEMIKKIKPQKFDDLIRISGLLHGAGIWTDNGEKLFDAGINFSKLPAFRDDMMLMLMEYGVERKKAFMISEKVRKGKGLQEWEYDELLDMNVPGWFLNLCDNIKCLFPKVHAADYVRTAFILAYYKAHFRAEFEKNAMLDIQITIAVEKDKIYDLMDRWESINSGLWDDIFDYEILGRWTCEKHLCRYTEQRYRIQYMIY